jgi:hypothetical protein
MPLHQYWYIWSLPILMSKNGLALVRILVISALLALLIYSTSNEKEQLLAVIIHYFIIFMIILRLHSRKEYKLALSINKIVLYLWIVYLFQIIFTDAYLVIFEDLTWSGNYELLRNSISENKSITVFGAHNYAAAAYFIIFNAEYNSKKKLTTASAAILILLALTKSWSGLFYILASALIILNSAIERGGIIRALILSALITVSFVAIYWLQEYLVGDQSNGFMARIGEDTSFMLGVQLVIDNGFSFAGFAPSQFTDSGLVIYLWRFGIILGSILTIIIWRRTTKIIGVFGATAIAAQNIFLPVYSSVQIMSLILLIKIVVDNSKNEKK